MGGGQGLLSVSLFPGDVFLLTGSFLFHQRRQNFADWFLHVSPEKPEWMQTMGVKAGWAARQKEGVVEGVIKLQTADASGEAAGTPPGGVQGADPINQCESQPTQTFLRSRRACEAELESWPERARLSLTPLDQGFDKLCGTFCALSSLTRGWKWGPSAARRLQRWKCVENVGCVCVCESVWVKEPPSSVRLTSPRPPTSCTHSCLSPTALPGIVLGYVGPVLLFLHHFYQQNTFTQEDGFTEKLLKPSVRWNVSDADD